MTKPKLIKPKSKTIYYQSKGGYYYKQTQSGGSSRISKQEFLQYKKGGAREIKIINKGSFKGTIERQKCKNNNNNKKNNNNNNNIALIHFNKEDEEEIEIHKNVIEKIKTIDPNSIFTAKIKNICNISSNNKTIFKYGSEEYIFPPEKKIEQFRYENAGIELLELYNQLVKSSYSVGSIASTGSTGSIASVASSTTSNSSVIYTPTDSTGSIASVASSTASNNSVIYTPTGSTASNKPSVSINDTEGGNPDNFNVDNFILCFANIFYGLKILAKHNMIHKDIKLENITYKIGNNNNNINNDKIYLIDFDGLFKYTGKKKDLDESINNNITTYNFSTPFFTPIEIILYRLLYNQDNFFSKKNYDDFYNFFKEIFLNINEINKSTKNIRSRRKIVIKILKLKEKIYESIPKNYDINYDLYFEELSNILDNNVEMEKFENLINSILKNMENRNKEIINLLEERNKNNNNEKKLKFLKYKLLNIIFNMDKNFKKIDIYGIGKILTLFSGSETIFENNDFFKKNKEDLEKLIYSISNINSFKRITPETAYNKYMYLLNKYAFDKNNTSESKKKFKNYLNNNIHLKKFENIENMECNKIKGMRKRCCRQNK
tara:strand:- start:207 stop:2021 length:1815 start_codon:yes stop_codon:yes gene_type:complete